MVSGMTIDLLIINGVISLERLCLQDLAMHKYLCRLRLMANRSLEFKEAALMEICVFSEKREAILTCCDSGYSF
jgi:hypothetical protein